jgi:uncharacterized protein with HEPN domain
MNEKVLKCLFEIKFSIEQTKLFFVNRQKRFEEYAKDIIQKRAIERNLEIIGKAMSRILKVEPDFPIENAKLTIGLQNK